MDNDFHPCSFAPLSVWVRLIYENGGVPRAFWGRAARLLGLSALTAPLRLAEYLRHSKRVDEVELAPPLFVLGYARSGTTHLQNLLVQDARFGCFTTWQGATSPFALTGRGWLKRLVEKGVARAGEQTRPMDNVRISLDTPQEEDLAVANAAPTSFVHQLSFPQQTMRMLEKWVLLRPDAVSAAELLRWERSYLRVLRKASLLADGKPLMLRNTVNIGRVDQLLRLFPRAKFIHIVRSPYAVYPSCLHLYRTLLPLYQLDHCDWSDMEAWLVEMYRRTMTKYLRDREAIPAGQLAEVRYEDLERDPLGELARLYAELALPDWREAAPDVHAYVQTLAGYQKNKLPLDGADVDLVSDQWRFALEAWGYGPPSTSGVDETRLDLESAGERRND